MKKLISGFISAVLFLTIPLVLSISAFSQTPYEFVLEWGTEGTGDGEFDDPWGVAIDSEGNIYVADLHNNRVQKFDSDGNFITKWGNLGGGNGEFNSTTDVAFDSNGYVYVVDCYNHRIQKFNSIDGISYTYVAQWGSCGSGDGQFLNPGGIGVDSNNNVYVADTYNHRVQKFDADGNFITKWGSYGSGDIEFDYPYDVECDLYDYVYVVDTWNHRVQKFDADGNFIAVLGGYGIGDGQFNAPIKMAFDTAGNYYVADIQNHRFQKFDSGGGFLGWWGLDNSGFTGWHPPGNETIGVPGSGDGQFNRPYGIAVDEIGNVYVAGVVNNRIQKFAPPFLTVTIDIKPGSYPNSINLGSNGNVPVAIFSTADFDATTVDPLTVTLAGASVRIKGKGTPQASLSDVDGDGLLDMIVHVDTTALQLSETNTNAILEGETFDGRKIRGEDTVRVIY